ncbi:hypothetical protein N185_15760 [Sinorhizobium sp. GW3]|nr:hypothetical protein N185_15760 [Sinorhizobium sp. GW3]
MCGQMSTMMRASWMGTFSFEDAVLSTIAFVGRVAAEILFVLTSGPVLSLIITLGTLGFLALAARALLRSLATDRKGTPDESNK